MAKVILGAVCLQVMLAYRFIVKCIRQDVPMPSHPRFSNDHPACVNLSLLSTIHSGSIKHV